MPKTLSNDSDFSIRNLTGKRVATTSFRDIKRTVLGKQYELSLVFISPARARALNKKHRGKTYVANVLSFALPKKSGEMFICPEVAAKEASQFGRSTKKHTADLFIHGLFHLKGLPHGSRMERQEAHIRTFFKF